MHWPCLSPSNRDPGDALKYTGRDLCGIGVLGSHRIRGEAKKHCSWDDAALCPSEWQLTAKWCIAPHGYKGACALFMRQGPYSRDQMQVQCCFVSTPVYMRCSVQGFVRELCIELALPANPVVIYVQQRKPLEFAY